MPGFPALLVIGRNYRQGFRVHRSSSNACRHHSYKVGNALRRQ